MCALLHHCIDEILLVALHNDAEKKECGVLVGGHPSTATSLSEQCDLVSNEEVPAGVHDYFSEDRRGTVLAEECAVDKGDGFQADRECLAEGQELQVYLRELYVELLEVSDVVREEFLEEVRLDELCLECVFTRPEQGLVGV